MSRIAYVINNAEFLVSHRLPLVEAARDAGYICRVITGQSQQQARSQDARLEIAKANIPLRTCLFQSSNNNFILDVIGFFQLVINLVRFNPEIVHCVSLKGILFGGIAARLCRVPRLVLAVSGLGYLYTQEPACRRSRKFLRFLFESFLHFAIRHKNVRLIVQNTDDRKIIQDNWRVPTNKISLIPGSGVKLKLFETALSINKELTVLFPARLLRDKGVEEFVQAARIIKKIEPHWRFILAGEIDRSNPSAITDYDISIWRESGIVEILGYVQDMAPLFLSASVVCLPSYREGFPKALQEAAAAACAVVTTDVPGCRDAIIEGKTGDLVPSRNVKKLAEVLLDLLKDSQRRKEYGRSGFEYAIKNFSIERIIGESLKIYHESQRDHV